MKVSAVLGLLLASGAGTSAFAASITTEQFIATIEPTIAYLDASSRLALQASKNGRVSAFARAEARDATAMSDGVAAWRETDVREAAEAASAPSLDRLGPVAGVLSVPLDAAAALNRGLASPVAPLASKSDLDAAQRQDLTHLAALDGADFEAFYASTEQAALLRLTRALKDYVLNGDDATLRRLAVRNLPRVESRLAAAKRL